MIVICILVCYRKRQMTHGRLPQNPEGGINQENHDSPMDGGLAEAVRMLTEFLDISNSNKCTYLGPKLGVVQMRSLCFTVTQIFLVMKDH